MRTLIFLALLMTAGCVKKGAEPPQAIGEFQVVKLFTHEGCTVYRFVDSRTVYYTNCSGYTQWSRSCGKNCTRNEGVDTYVEQP